MYIRIKSLFIQTYFKSQILLRILAGDLKISVDFRFHKKLVIFWQKMEITAYKQGFCNDMEYFVKPGFFLFMDIFCQQKMRTASNNTVMVPEDFKVV